jgi:hypothetical protein
MNRHTSFLYVGLVALLLAGCAHYAQVRVRVVDKESQVGIPQAQLRAFYVKPMLSMTYQWKDRARTDRDGWATLTVATNFSQWMIGWEYGIIPFVSAEKLAYRKRDASLVDVIQKGDLKVPIIIEMEKEN